MDVIQTRSFEAASLSTLAKMASLPGPGGQRAIVKCAEVDAPYEFVPGDATPVDGWTTIAPTPDTGRYLLRSRRVSIAALGGGLDDWPRLNSAMVACKGKAEIVRRAGAWSCQSTLAGDGTRPGIPDDTVMEDEGPGVVTTSTLAPTVSTNANSVFYANAAAIGDQGALAAAPVIGSDQILFVKDVAIPDGSYVVWGNGTNNVQQMAKVRTSTVDAGGRYVVVIDDLVEMTAVVAHAILVWRGAYNIGTNYIIGDAVSSGGVIYTALVNNVGVVPVGNPGTWFPSVTQVQQYLPCRNIHLKGNGSIITGTGDRTFDIGFGDNCIIEDFEVNASAGVFTTACHSWDSASRDCLIRRVTFDGGFGLGGVVSAWGFALESNVRCFDEDCYANFVGDSAGDAGFQLLATRNGGLRGCRAENCYDGLRISSITAGDDTSGQRLSITDCLFNGNRNDGISIVGEALDVDLSSVQSSYNGRHGLSTFLVGALNPRRINLDGFTANSNVGNGLHIANGSRVVGGRVTVADNTGIGLNVIDTAEVTFGTVIGESNRLGTVVNSVQGAAGAATISISELVTRNDLTHHVQCTNGSRTWIGTHRAYDELSLVVNSAGHYVDGDFSFLRCEQYFFTSSSTVFVSAAVCGVTSLNANSRIEYGRAIAIRSAGANGAAFYIVAHGVITGSLKTQGAWANGCYAVDGTCMFRLSDDSDCTSAATDYGSGGAQSPNGGPPSYNFGTFQLNGAAAVATAFADARAADGLEISCALKAGTGTGLSPEVAIVPGTGINVPAGTQANGDTSTWRYRIR